MAEIRLAEEEAIALAGSISKLSEYYDISLEFGKYGAWAGLLATLGMIYGPRAKAIMTRRREAKAARASAAPATPFDMPMAPVGGYDLGATQGVN